MATVNRQVPFFTPRTVVLEAVQTDLDELATLTETLEPLGRLTLFTDNKLVNVFL